MRNRLDELVRKRLREQRRETERNQPPEEEEKDPGPDLAFFAIGEANKVNGDLSVVLEETEDDEPLENQNQVL